MSSVPFSWMWGDPAEVVDRLRILKDRLEKAEKEQLERDRRRKARKIRKLVKAAKARVLKGQR